MDRGKFRLARLAIGLLAFGVLGLRPGTSAAGIYTWMDYTGSWADTNLWVGGVAPSGTDNTDILIFGNSAGQIYTANHDLFSGTLNQIKLENNTAGVTQTNVGNQIQFAGTSPQLLQNGAGGFIFLNDLSLQNGTAFGGTGSGLVVLRGVISGIGTLTKSGGGPLELTAANTFSGGTVINSGLLRVNNPTGSGLGTGPVAVNSGGTLGGTGAVSGPVTVNGGGHLAPGNSVGLQQVGTLTLNSSSVLDFQFATSPAANDQIIVNNANGLTANGGGFNLLTENGTDPVADRFSGSGLYNLIGYSGVIGGSGPGALSVLNLADTHTYNFGAAGGFITLSIGGTNVSWTGTAGLPGGPWNWTVPGNWSTAVTEGDVLVFDGDKGLNNQNDFPVNTWFNGMVFTNTAGAFILNGSALKLRGNVVNRSALTQTINLPLVLEGGSREFNAANGDLLVNGAIGESGAALGLVKTGSQLLTLAASNTYSGVTEIQGGTLRAANGLGLPTASNLKLNGGVLESSGSFTRSLGTSGGQVQWTGNGGFSAYGGTLSVNLGGAGATATWGSGNFVSGNNQLLFSSPTANGTVKFLNPLALGSGMRTIEVANGSAAVDVNFANGITGSGSLTKTGPGTMLLSANDTYSGTTRIDDGKLLVNGTLTSGGAGVLVNGGAALGGTGLVNRAVTVSSAGALAPGMSAGVLTVSSLSLLDGFLYDWELGVTATDRVEVTTSSGITFGNGDSWTLNLGLEPGVLDLPLWQGASHTNDLFVLFELSSGTAPLSLANAIISGGAWWNTTDAQVLVQDNEVLLTGIYLNEQAGNAVPEPGVVWLWASGAAVIWLTRRRCRAQSGR